MMNLVVISASSLPVLSTIESDEAESEPRALEIMIFCVIEIEGEGDILSLPGILFWKITSGNIKITYLGGEYTATSGSGIFILHLGGETENPIDINGVAPIGITI